MPTQHIADATPQVRLAYGLLRAPLQRDNEYLSLSWSISLKASARRHTSAI